MYYHFKCLLEDIDIKILKNQFAFDFQSPYLEKLNNEIINFIENNYIKSPVFIVIENSDNNILIASDKKNTFLITKKSIFYYDSSFSLTCKINSVYSHQYSKMLFGKILSDCFFMIDSNKVTFDISTNYFKHLSLVVNPYNSNRVKIISNEVNSKNKNLLDELYFNLEVDKKHIHIANFEQKKSNLIEHISFNNDADKKYNVKFYKNLEKNLSLDKNNLNINTYDDLKKYLSGYLEVDNLINDRSTKIITKKHFNENLNMFIQIIINKENIFNIPFEKHYNFIKNTLDITFSNTQTTYDKNNNYQELFILKNSILDCTSSNYHYVQNDIFISKILFLIKSGNLDLFNKEFISSINELIDGSKEITSNIKKSSFNNILIRDIK